jgi:hypothetical protein
MNLLRLPLFFLLATLLFTSGCALFRKKPKAAPVVETVRTEDSPTPPAAARDLADVMTSTLGLRPDQTIKVRQILNETVADVNAARQKFAPKSPQLMAELKRINASSEGQLRTVLGAGTFAQYQAKRRQMAEEMRNRKK